MRITRILSVLSVTCLLAACGADHATTTDPTVVETTDAPGAALDTSTTLVVTETTGPAVTGTTGPEGQVVQLPGAGSPGVDLTLGEWALVPSVGEAPPGTITFRFRNQGTVDHALRIRTTGSGKNRLEWRAEAVSPGETALLVADLPPGTYEIDCPVEDGHGEHDQLGMEIVFTVREGAPALAPLSGQTDQENPPTEAGVDPTVTIAQFAFGPAELSVPVGATVTWANSDPTQHTATGDGFDTGPIDEGAAATVTFDEAGTYAYFCAIHPTMEGRVVVGP
jgi:plastocyanin